MLSTWQPYTSATGIFLIILIWWKPVYTHRPDSTLVCLGSSHFVVETLLIIVSYSRDTQIEPQAASCWRCQTSWLWRGMVSFIMSTAPIFHKIVGRQFTSIYPQINLFHLNAVWNWDGNAENQTSNRRSYTRTDRIKVRCLLYVCTDKCTR